MVTISYSKDIYSLTQLLELKFRCFSLFSIERDEKKFYLPGGEVAFGKISTKPTIKDNVSMSYENVKSLYVKKN